MAEDEFFSMFMDALRESVGRLAPPEPRSEWARNLYMDKWKSEADSYSLDAAVVACDGSIGESRYSGGLGSCFARAVAHTYCPNGEVRHVRRVAVEIDYGFEGSSHLMKALELETLTRAIDTARGEFKRVFALFDGSIYLTFFHYPPRIEAMLKVFERYVNALTACIEIAQKRGVSIVGLSKDSNIGYLRSKIIHDAILQANPSIGELLRGKPRNVKKMAEDLKGVLAGQDTVLLSYVDELKSGTSDEALYSELAQEPGFTVPLLLAPQTYFITTEIKQGTTSWLDSAFREQLLRSAKFDKLVSALDKYYGQPPIAVSYWKAWPEVGTHRIDIPSNLLGYEGSASDLHEDEFVDEKGVEAARALIRSLNGLGQKPYVASPLTEVDVAARLPRSVYKKTYETMITEELTRRGFGTITKRRDVRDKALRGY